MFCKGRRARRSTGILSNIVSSRRSFPRTSTGAARSPSGRRPLRDLSAAVSGTTAARFEPVESGRDRSLLDTARGMDQRAAVSRRHDPEVRRRHAETPPFPKQSGQQECRARPRQHRHANPFDPRLRSFRARPHTDAVSKIVTAIFYLPRDARMSVFGTSIYRPKERGFTAWKCPHLPHEQFDLVRTVPFVPNSMFVFMKSDRSFHGVEPGDYPNSGRDMLMWIPEIGRSEKTWGDLSLDRRVFEPATS